MESHDPITLVGTAEPPDAHTTGTPKEAGSAAVLASRAGSLQRRIWSWVHSSGGLWLPLLVCAAGSVLSVVAGNALISYEAREVEAALDSTASNMARAIEGRFSRQAEELHDQGLAWSEHGVDERKWQSEAELLLKRSKAILAIEWLSSTAPKAFRIESAAGMPIAEALRRDGPILEERQKALLADTESFLGPYAVDDKQVFELVIPIEKDKETQRLSAILDPAALVEGIPRSDTHLFAITLGDRVLVQRGEMKERPTLPAKEETVDLPRGENWTLRVQPDPQLQSLGSRLPRWILLAGLVISVLLAAMVRLGQVTWTGSRELLEANTRLNSKLREVELTHERTRALAATLREERQTLRKENQALREESQMRGEDVVHQDSVVAELEAFTYSVSHDLRSPLGAILNYAAALTEDCGGQLDENGREYLTRISGSARSAVAMMDGLLVFSRVGRHELKRSQVDVRELVREVYDELASSSNGRRLELSMGELPPVEADRTLMRVLVTNLLSNAVKFTAHAEAPKLEVGGYSQGGETVYYFEDNGIGFDMQDAGRLFGVFERLHGSNQYEGHGVGLAVVERIARRHGGSVRAEAVLGKGATFFVNLPQGQPSDGHAT
jgi:signal transduction histidine kinase